jgi:D-lactate dehydrogenase
MKIAFFETKPEEKEYFSKHLSGYDVTFFEKTINEIEGECDFDIISVFIHSKIDKNVLDKCKNLKYIQTRSTGVDHLNLAEIYKRGILASNVVGYAGASVGEFAFGLLLEAVRKIYIAIERVKKGDLYYKDLKGMEVNSKTVGVLGLGTIGFSIAKIAKGFGANVIGFSRTKKDIFEGVLEWSESLDTVLKRSDFLFLALPLTKSTKNIINTRNIKKFKGKVIINPARAEIIQKEVYETFEGIIAADVLPDWNLAKKENIIATPHMAYYTKEALFKIMEISLLNLEDFLNGNKPRGCLKPFYEKEG